MNIPPEQVEGLENINTMKLDHNTLTNMTDISNLPTLETFKIGYNVISKIPYEFIEGLPNMRRFYCNNNKIYILPNMSRYFPRLEELSVEGNYLETLPDMYEMQPVFTLTAAENPYTCNVSLCWLRMLPWMKIHFKYSQRPPSLQKAIFGYWHREFCISTLLIWSVTRVSSQQYSNIEMSLQWRRNLRDSVSDNRRLVSLLNRLFRHKSK